MKRFPTRVVTLLAMLGLAACAASPKYDDYLSQYAQISEEELVRQWGQPSNAYEDGGMKFLTYKTSSYTNVMTAPAIYQPYFDGKTVHHRIVQAERWERMPVKCETTFVLEEGVVSAWHHQGNGCVAKTR